MRFLIDVNYRFCTVQPYEDGGPDAHLYFYLAGRLPLDLGEPLEWTDDEGNDMFPSALAKLGQAAQGENYSLFPALAARGDNISRNLTKVPAREYRFPLN